jgi:ribosome recycling factor
VEPGQIISETEKGMQAAVKATSHECQKIRTGRANIALLDGIMVDCYGTSNPIQHVANLTVPESRMIVIQPYDRSNIRAIETAIQKADIGINPNNDGNVIRLVLPDLTEERRKELVKIAKKIGEEGKVAIRNHRHKANDAIKKGEKDGAIPEDDGKHMLDEVQRLTDKYNEEIDNLLKEKEEEIMTF